MATNNMGSNMMNSYGMPNDYT